MASPTQWTWIWWITLTDFGILIKSCILKKIGHDNYIYSISFDLICKYSVENYCIYVNNKEYWLAIYFSCSIFTRLSYQDTVSNNLGASRKNIRKNLCRNMRGLICSNLVHFQKYLILWLALGNWTLRMF